MSLTKKVKYNRNSYIFLIKSNKSNNLFYNYYKSLIMRNRYIHTVIPIKKFQFRKRFIHNKPQDDLVSEHSNIQGSQSTDINTNIQNDYMDFQYDESDHSQHDNNNSSKESSEKEDDNKLLEDEETDDEDDKEMDNEDDEEIDDEDEEKIDDENEEEINNEDEE